MAYTSGAFICKKCGATYDDFLYNLKNCPDCDGEMIYHSVSDRYEAQGYCWCQDLGGYYCTKNCDPDMCGVANPLNCPRIRTKRSRPCRCGLLL